MPERSIDTDTRLVINNAIYFKAPWNYQFQGDVAGQFNLLDGKAISLTMMKEFVPLGYLEGDNYKAVELPYLGGEQAMDIIVPEAGAI